MHTYPDVSPIKSNGTYSHRVYWIETSEYNPKLLLGQHKSLAPPQCHHKSVAKHFHTDAIVGRAQGICINPLVLDSAPMGTVCDILSRLAWRPRGHGKDREEAGGTHYLGVG